MWLFLSIPWLAIADEPFVQVLGIAQDAGHPQIGCVKRCCNGGQHHAVSSLAIVDGGQAWIVDATPDFPAQHRRLADVQLAGVLLSHGHIGHYTGLMYLGREAMAADRLPVYGTERMRTLLTENAPWSQLVSLNNIVPLPFESQLSSRIRVSTFPVPHRDELTDTVGFFIEGPSKSVVYIPDIDKWERWETPIEEWILRADVAYLDGTFYDGDELPGRAMSEIPHPFIADTLKRLAPLEERGRVRFIHLNHSNPALDETSSQWRGIRAAGLRVAQENERVGL